MKRPTRTPSQYRIYSDKDVQRLRFVRHAKNLGCTLGEIKHIIDLRERQTCPCGEVLRIGDQHLSEIEARIKQLTDFRDQLARAIKQWRKSPTEEATGDAICVLIERTMVEAPSSSEEGRKEKWHSNKVKSTSARTRSVV